MDVLEMRVPEYFGRSRMERVPISCAVKKSEYIKDRREIIAQMDKKISELEKKMSVLGDKESYSYKDAAKRLKKFYEIKQNCEYSILLAKEQMNISKR